MAPNLRANYITPFLPIAMASHLRATAPNLRANYIRPFLPFLLFLFLIAMASNLSDGPQPRSKLYQTFLTFFFVSNRMASNLSDGPQPKSKLYQTFLTFSSVFVCNSNGLPPKSDGPQPKSKLYQTFLTFSSVFVCNSNGLPPKSDGPQPKSKLYQTFLTLFLFLIAMASNLLGSEPTKKPLGFEGPQSPWGAAIWLHLGHGRASSLPSRGRAWAPWALVEVFTGRREDINYLSPRFMLLGVSSCRAPHL